MKCKGANKLAGLFLSSSPKGLETTEGPDPIRYSGVEISGGEICELWHEKPFLKVPREHIKLIKLSLDTPARNPFCQFFMGFIMVFMSTVWLAMLFLASWSGILAMELEEDVVRVPLAAMALWVMAGGGFWLLLGVFRSRYQFIIQTEHRVRKIFFEKAASTEGLDIFIRKARLDFGYEIDNSVLEAKGLPH
jgi:hypothetical protein